MASMDEQILRAAKEIVVKFIETGRVSPTSFPQSFDTIYSAISATVNPPAPSKKREGNSGE